MGIKVANNLSEYMGETTPAATTVTDQPPASPAKPKAASKSSKATTVPVPNTIVLRLCKLRTDAGLTQEGLALDLFEAGYNVGSSDISKYEREKCLPTTEVLCRLCKMFHVSADYTLFGKQELAPMPRMTALMEANILALADEIRACRESK